MCQPSDTTASQREWDLEEKRWMQRLSSIVPKGQNLMDQSWSSHSLIESLKLFITKFWDQILPISSYFKTITEFWS